ncbi:MAG: hypothetical protein IPK73_02030 [Candidatus Obscuribacter sp.]|nr:hypothetical protein [Candidatus Obscuribacter sp.]MBK9280219.1 hypothetical protein [Candidatus Obscuribacter sp.]HMW91383.1 hypothetical protein [Candidatus Obscuribacter sp.]HNA73681.1 hypothetical protein [Candidatus Obscuribacter sp.]
MTRELRSPRTSVASIASLASVLILASGLALSQTTGAEAQGNAAQTLKLIQTGKFKQAYPSIKAMAQAGPREMSLQYYLGICAQGIGDKPTAELALTRVIVGTEANSPYNVNAMLSLQKLQPTLRPYSCTRAGKSQRWAPQSMPLKMYITDGQGVNPNLSGRDLAATEVTQVVNHVRTGGLHPQAGYKPSFKRAIADGIQVWDWAIKAKLVNFALVGSPNNADVIVLYCQRTQEGFGGITVCPPEKGQPCIVQISLEQAAALPEAEAFRLIKQRAAVQIGHVMGLARSSSPQDLMYESSQNPTAVGAAAPSQNDLASLRALYSMPCDIFFK